MKTQHVKSHQDWECDRDQLPWQAKLHYDFEAAQVRSCEKCQKQRKKSYIFPPGHAAALQLGKVLMTIHLPLAIRNAA
jgi:hypothetical protein